jgi:hypothetical protein
VDARCLAPPRALGPGPQRKRTATNARPREERRNALVTPEASRWWLATAASREVPVKTCLSRPSSGTDLADLVGAGIGEAT